MHDIMLDGVLDTSPEGHVCHAAVKLGDVNYGGPARVGETARFRIGNVQTRARYAIVLGAPLADSMIDNVLMFRTRRKSELIGHHGGTHEFKNVVFHNCEVIDIAEDADKLP